jgi:alkyl sulfatase BDS1-like metallo-beta-lactamase superfamily hydrolase
VTEGVYQMRGYDISNMTLIRAERLDRGRPAHRARDTAAAPRSHGPPRRRTVVAVIFTHSHVDHFGGIVGVLPDETSQRSVRIVAPLGFVEEATSENVLAGVAMGRRASFMYGMPLARSPRGHVDTGLGKAPARGTIDILEPTDRVDHTGQELELDGVRFVFQYAPHSEAPAELTFYLPASKAWCGAEIVSHNLHNLYTLRGAKVRDALAWSGYIDEAIERFGDTEVVFASHHWPVTGNARVLAYLKQQRDTYRFLHDQTLRLANAGLGPRRSPRRWSCRPRCARRSRTATTTAPSATTRRRCTRPTSAGTTAIPRTWIRCRPPKRRRTTSRRWAAPTRCCARAAKPKRAASRVGPRCC